MALTANGHPRRHWLASFTPLGLALSLSLLGFGCAATVKDAVKTATPAAVEGAVDKASEPNTRDDLAKILDDAEIRASSAKLSASLAKGVLSGVQEEAQLAQIQRLTDVLVSSVGQSLVKSLERDVAPQIFRAVNRVLDLSFERALNAESEARLQAMVGSVTRATLTGAGEAVSQVTSDANPALRLALAQATRDVVYNGALGLDSAVRDAQALPDNESELSVLASIGTLTQWMHAIPTLLVGGAALLVLALLAALLWALWALRRERRLAREHTSATLQLADALKSAEGSDWFSDFCKQAARGAQQAQTSGKS